MEECRDGNRIQWRTTNLHAWILQASCFSGCQSLCSSWSFDYKPVLQQEYESCLLDYAMLGSDGCFTRLPCVQNLYTGSWSYKRDCFLVLWRILLQSCNDPVVTIPSLVKNMSHNASLRTTLYIWTWEDGLANLLKNALLVWKERRKQCRGLC